MDAVTDTPKRSVGPVTGAITGSMAATTLIVWGLSFAGVDVPPLVQGSITVLIGILAGWAVKPRKQGDHAA